ncbi:MAG TPA: GNAT family N-acetyltransferase [Nocardioidaceae bacterium]|nr:GNAT family N-acetyltransferase [Nocardioidaceae bacterium]
MDRPLRLAAVAFTDADARALVDQVQQEYVGLYGEQDNTPLDAGMFVPPQGAFFVAYDGGVPVAMGGWRRRSDVRPWGRSAAAEIKRMYVAPAARRRGIARAVLAHLERTARDAGADVMVLETGAAQPEAIALYAAQGYLPIEKFGHYCWSPQQRCFGKPL